MEKKNHPISTTRVFSRDALAGGIAGGVARLLSSPFDVLKIRYQLQSIDKPKYKNMFNSFKMIIKEEGMLALWKGNLSATYLYITYAMCQFGVYGVFKDLLTTIPDPFASRRVDTLSDLKADNRNVSSPKWQAFMLFLAGSLAGITATAATYPFDLMRTQFALQGKAKFFNSMSSFVMFTMEKPGITGFYTGLGPAVLGVAPYMGLNFAIYESLNRYVDNRSNIANERLAGISSRDSGNGNNNTSVVDNMVRLLKKGAVGGMSGGVSKFIVFPLDTVKRRLQYQVLKNSFEHTLHEVATAAAAGVAPSHSGPQYGGLLDCIRTIWKIEGIGGFYKGIVPTTVKSITSTALTFAFYELSKDILNKLYLDEEESNRKRRKED